MVPTIATVKCRDAQKNRGIQTVNINITFQVNALFPSITDTKWLAFIKEREIQTLNFVIIRKQFQDIYFAIVSHIKWLWKLVEV